MEIGERHPEAGLRYSSRVVLQPSRRELLGLKWAAGGKQARGGKHAGAASESTGTVICCISVGVRRWRRRKRRWTLVAVVNSVPWPSGSLLARLSEPERLDLLYSGTQVTFSRGDVLLRQGEPGTELFVLVSGCAKVTWMAATGTDTILALRGRGDLVGEFAVIDEMPRTAWVISLNSLTAVRVARAEFLAFCESHPGVTRVVMQSLTDKVRQATGFPVVGRTLNARMRLAGLLYNVAAQYGAWQLDGTVVVPPLTQADLAALAAVATSTVERTLKELRDNGIVLSGYRQTVVLDMDALLAQAAGQWR